MNKFQRQVSRRALRFQNKLYTEIENKYPDETVVNSIPTDNPHFNQIVFGPNIDNYINDIQKVPSIYKLKKQIRKEFKALYSL